MRWGTPAAALCAFFLASGIASAQDQTATPPPTTAQNNAPQSAAPPASVSSPTAQTSMAPATEPNAPALLQDAVRLSPVPKASLLIPRGWFACDDASNKLLGNVSLPSVFTDKLCSPTAPNNPPLRVIDPNLAQLMVVMAFQINDRSVTPKYFKTLSSKKLQAQIDQMCTMARASQGLTASDCNLALSSVAGHQALTGLIVGTRPNSQLVIHMRFAAIPMDGYALAFVVADLNADQAKTEPLGDAIFNSITIE